MRAVTGKLAKLLALQTVFALRIRMVSSSIPIRVTAPVVDVEDGRSAIVEGCVDAPKPGIGKAPAIDTARCKVKHCASAATGSAQNFQSLLP